MPLTSEQIKQLLALPQNQGKGKGRKPKNYIDTSIRDVVTWFKLGHRWMDHETREVFKCENPNCQDTRDHPMVAEVNGSKMCRRCFLDGWLSLPTGQGELLDDSSE